MLKEITLGQFFPGDSLLHKTDPRAKIILTLLYISASSRRKTLSFLFVVLFTLLLVAISKSR